MEGTRESEAEAEDGRESEAEGVPLTSSLSLSRQCPLPPHIREGFEYLEMFLLRNFEHGILASPFGENVKTNLSQLHHMVLLHGIILHGLTSHDCRILLLHHIFSGDCVSSHCSFLDRTACFHFSRGFQSVKEMSFAAFQIVSSGTAINTLMTTYCTFARI